MSKQEYKIKKCTRKGYWIPGGFNSSGSWVDSMYEKKTVEDWEEFCNLVNKNGWEIDFDMGLMALNMVHNLMEKSKKKTNRPRKA